MTTTQKRKNGDGDYGTELAVCMKVKRWGRGYRVSRVLMDASNLGGKRSQNVVSWKDGIRLSVSLASTKEGVKCDR